MLNDVLDYYEEELRYLRQSGEAFAKDYPRLAGQLRLEADQSPDPHVERLLQGFAFIAGRIHRKIDEEFPEIAEALLNVLYPHYLAPTPAMAVAQFVPDAEQGQLTGGYPIPKHTPLYSTQTINGAQCRFRTCYPVTLLPLRLESASFESANNGSIDKAVGVIRLQLRAQGEVKFSSLAPELHTLRFFLNGEDKLAHALYELLFNHTLALRIHNGEAAPPGEDQSSLLRLQPVGFGKDEGLLPYPSNAFLGYRLLHEYFAFPQKFLFVDVCGLDRLLDARYEDKLEIQIYVDRAPSAGPKISKENFLLGCAPIINLFKKTAEPINVDGARTEYRVIPDLRQRALEIFSIDNVASASPLEDAPRAYQPLYSFKHAAHAEDEAFWYARRKPAANKDDAGAELYLAVVDLAGNAARLGHEAVSVQTTCTNRDLPSHLSFEPGEDQRHFEIEEKAPLNSIRCVVMPTPALRPRSKGEAQWRLISHLSLNYLSLTDSEEKKPPAQEKKDGGAPHETQESAETATGDDGRQALQEILTLYNFTGSLANQHQIERIKAIKSRRVVRRLSDVNGGSFGRGLEVTLTLDDEHYPEHDIFLFSAVLEKFLGLYVSLNSFSELKVQTTRRESQAKAPLKTWPPRAGEKTLL